MLLTSFSDSSVFRYGCSLSLPVLCFSLFPFCLFISTLLYLYLFLSVLKTLLFPCSFYHPFDIISVAIFFLLFFVPLQFCLLASLRLASSVSVSLLVFFWKITRSGALRVHVFCAGCIDWMGWLQWAAFLCGPPANFMIYSAKGRGARPPVTTERELHVGLMISPQKCLLWLGLHGAPSPPETHSHTHTCWMCVCKGGWGVEKRARLTSLSQYKRLPLHIYLEGLRGKKGTDSKLHPVGMFQMFQSPISQQMLSDSCVHVVILYHAFCYFSLSIPAPRDLEPVGDFRGIIKMWTLRMM